MRLLIFTVALLASFAASGQLVAEYDFRVATSPPGAGTYGVNGFFLDTDGRGVTPGGVRADTTYYFDTAGRLFIVRSKGGNSPFQLGLDPVGHSSSPQTGVGQLTDLSDKGIPYYSGGVSPKVRAAVNARQITVIDPQLGTGGGGGTPTYQEYANDSQAAAAGVGIGEQYRAGVGNTRGLPQGTITTRIQ